MTGHRGYAIVLAGLVGLVSLATLLAQQDKAVEEFVSLLKQGMSLVQRGKPKEAIKPFEAAQAKAEKAFGEEHELTSLSLQWLGRAYADQAEYSKAEQFYLRSLKIREAKLKDDPSLANALNNLADVYRVSGQYAKAEPLYRRSLQVWKAKGHPDVALALNNLGALYHAMGQYAKAELLLQESLKTMEGSLGKEHPEVAAALNNLAELYRDLGQYAKAEPLYRRSLQIKEALGEGHPDVALALNNFGLLYQAMRQPTKAEPSFLRALKIWEGLDKEHPHVATFLNNLAEAYRASGRHAEAEPLLLRGLKIREARLGKEHSDVATSLNNLAALYHATGQLAKAEVSLRRSLKIWETRQGMDHPDVALALNNLAGLQSELGRTKDAASLFDRTRQSSRRQVSRVLPALARREQAAFLAVSERDRLAWSLSLALGHPEERALAQLSAGWLLNGKAIAEEALAQAALLARDSRNPATARLAGKLREIRSRLGWLVLHPAPPGQEKSHQQELEELTKQERKVASDLAAAGGASIFAADWLDLGDVQMRLSSDAVFLDVARFDVYDFKAPRGKQWQPARYVAWVTPAKGDVRLVDLGPADTIDAAVTRVRQALEQAGRLIRQKGEPEAEKALRTPLAALSKLVLQPLLPQVRGAKRWVVSPDSNLWLIPWEILLLPDGKYAVEKHTLRYALSGRDLVGATRNEVKSGRSLVVADPDFDLDAKTARAETIRMLGNRNSDEELRGLSGLPRLGNIQRLRGTLAEATAIQKPLAAYTKQEPVQRLDREALEGVVKAVKNPRVLVLSTHGFFLPAERVKPSERLDEKATAPPGWENPLLRCGLLLAGCNDAAKAADGDDGVLTGLEVVGMDLRGCELVVLSACETGLGDVQNGEGVAGLRQAFRLAGAESVVSTLWQVPDRSSAQLMALFFQNLAKGKRRADALREAQLKVIEDRRDDTAAAHPFFWAAFTLTGR